MKKKTEMLVLVDENDKELGLETRENCHRGRGLMHRAFVVFLFRDNQLLLQRRSMKKLLWPGYWDVSVTSHVYQKEAYDQAGIRRTKQELGVSLGELKRILSFTYWAKYGKHAENEFCVLLTGTLPQDVHTNNDEVMETKYTTLSKLTKDIKGKPELYTPWLKIAFEDYQRFSEKSRS